MAFPHDAGDRPAALIAPLLAVEVGVHRWDLESVLGEHDAIPPDLAAREVDSVIENFVPRLASTGVTPIGGTVRLRATDAPSAGTSPSKTVACWRGGWLATSLMTPRSWYLPRLKTWR